MKNRGERKTEERGSRRGWKDNGKFEKGGEEAEASVAPVLTYTDLSPQQQAERRRRGVKL